MNTKEIEVLLEKYYDGNTGIDEEKLLREYFTGRDVAAHLKSHQPLFIFFADEKQHEMKGAGFDEKAGSQYNRPSAGHRVVPMHRGRGKFVYFTSIAATILLLVGFFFTFRQDMKKTTKSPADTYNQELAYAEASDALLFVSYNLNTGLKQVSRLQVIDKAMKNVQLFNKFYQYQSIIINPDIIENQSSKSN